MTKNWQPPAQILQHWCVFRNWNNLFFFLLGPLHPTYVNKKQEKEKKQKNKWRAYIYTFVQKRHMEPRHYWCSVYTQTRCRESHDRLFELHADFILLRQWPRGEEEHFLYKNKVFFFFFFFLLFTIHSTHLGSTESIWKSYITGINFKLFIQLSLNLFFFPFCWLRLICYWVLDDCQLWIG